MNRAVAQFSPLFELAQSSFLVQAVIAGLLGILVSLKM